jgi:hypothetical protein
MRLVRNVISLNTGAWSAVLAVAYGAVPGQYTGGRRPRPFHASAAHRGGVCREPPWRCMRHPDSRIEWARAWAGSPCHSRGRMAGSR